MSSIEDKIEVEKRRRTTGFIKWIHENMYRLYNEYLEEILGKEEEEEPDDNDWG